MKWASRVKDISAEMLALAARVAPQSGIQALGQNKQVPQLVRDALNAMQAATANVVGTDGHRRLCRYEGHAYMSLFGPPLIFMTPNLADTKQPLLLAVQGYKVKLDALEAGDVLPKYRDMMRRLARSPVAQTIVFEKIMRLFFLHVLGVRPECLENRRKSVRTHTREWCTDGVAAASVNPGVVGPVLAFRGEIEAQGRGSLHPHILVWLVGMSPYDVVQILQREPETMQERLREWMRVLVASMESTVQASSQALPRQFNNPDSRISPPGFSKVEKSLTLFDGGSCLDLLSATGEDMTAGQKAFLDQENPADWKRPDLALRDACGKQLEGNGEDVKPPSVYTRSIDSFAVAQFPKFRRFDTLHAADATVAEGDADPSLLPKSPEAQEWEKRFSDDIRALVSEILIHICGESCFKYSGTNVEKICRHGFYYVISLATGKLGEENEKDWQRRRRGKPLRNVMFVVKETEHGMQGRVLHFQEHPFEGQTNYAGLGAMRCNLDVQDLRRVLPEDLWLENEESLPHIGDRPEWGFMNFWEWNGRVYEPRLRNDVSLEGKPPERWLDQWSHDDWRTLYLKLYADEGAWSDLTKDLKQYASAAFRDGINTGFYINSYTTKHCPTMDGVLEELRSGIARLETTREAEKEALKKEALKTKPAEAAADGSTLAEQRRLRLKTPFAETLRTLCRLSSSYRRCYWKSGSEMLFPMLFGHMTFASHRCWTVYCKRAVFLASEAWRAAYGQSVRHACMRDGGGELIRYVRQGLDPYPLVGWRRCGEAGARFLEGPNGEKCESEAAAFDLIMANKRQSTGERDAVQTLTFLQKFLNAGADEKKQILVVVGR